MKNNKPLVSIIVPIYNKEKYLVRSIDSILSQVFNDFELILVDDGSTDQSGTICDKYVTQDSRVQVVHKENMGVSSARNVGLDLAKGKYLVFADSDDELLPEAIKKGVLDLERISADICIGGYIRSDYSGITSFLLSQDLIDHISRLAESDIVSLFENNYVASCCGKIYQREFVGTLRFDTNMIFGEDLKFNIELMKKDPFIIASRNTFFKYIATDNSLTSLTDIRKCRNVVETYSILYDYGLSKHYSNEGRYYSYVDKRWQNDLLTLENMILREESTILSKYSKIQILCSNKKLISRLSHVQDPYVTGYATRPLKLVLGYLVRHIKEQNK